MHARELHAHEVEVHIREVHACEVLSDGGCLFNGTSDVRLDRRMFSNRRPGLRLGSVLVEMKEDAELLDPAL